MINLVVSWIDPTANVAWESPTATVSISIPVMGVTYTVISLLAQLDTRGLHTIHREITEIRDEAVFLFEKADQDEIGISDQAVWDALLAKDEGIAFGDFFDRTCSFVREFPDVVGLSDYQVFSIDKVLADTAGISDVLTQSIAKPLNDGVALGDQMTQQVSKQCTDSFSFSERFTITGGNTYCDYTYFSEAYVTASLTI